MALATTTLSDAKMKMQSAREESAWGGGAGLAGEAQSSAAEVLVAARRAGDSATKLEALELLVEAHMFLGDTYAANMAATDEVAMIRRAGDKRSEAKAMQLLARVHSARGDAKGAEAALQGALAINRELEDKAGQSETLRLLANAKLAAGKKNDAMAPAQEALKLAEELGDADGVSAAKRTVNVIYAEKNQLDKAPDRPEALLALKNLAAAADERDSQAWNSAMKELDRIGAYTQKDVDETVSSALEKDRAGASTFLEEQGIVVRGSGTPQLQMKEYNKTLCYISFRLGALGYGPRFRCLSTYKKQVVGDESSLGAVSCLQISEQADDWETDLQFHPGVLDGMLQSGTAYSI